MNAATEWLSVDFREELGAVGKGGESLELMLIDEPTRPEYNQKPRYGRREVSGTPKFGLHKRHIQASSQPLNFRRPQWVALKPDSTP